MRRCARSSSGPSRTFVVDMVDSRLADGPGARRASRSTHRRSIPWRRSRATQADIGADPASMRRLALGRGHRTRASAAGHDLDGRGPQRSPRDFPYMQVWMKSLTFRAAALQRAGLHAPLLDLIAAAACSRNRSQPSHEAHDAEEAYREIFNGHARPPRSS